MALWRFLPPSSSSALFFTFHVGWMSESIEEEATAWAPRRKGADGQAAVLPSSFLPAPSLRQVFLPTSFVSLCSRCCGFGGGDSASFPSFFPFLPSFPSILFYRRPRVCVCDKEHATWRTFCQSNRRGRRSREAIQSMTETESSTLKGAIVIGLPGPEPTTLSS